MFSLVQVLLNPHCDESLTAILPEFGSMECDVIFNKARDEIIAVVIPRLHAQLQFLAAFDADGRQQLRLQLLLQEVVRLTLVHENFAAAASLPDEFD